MLDFSKLQELQAKVKALEKEYYEEILPLYDSKKVLKEFHKVLVPKSVMENN